MRFLLPALLLTFASPAYAASPALFAKSWAVGYLLVIFGTLLGVAAVTIPSMRKRRKKSS